MTAHTSFSATGVADGVGGRLAGAPEASDPADALASFGVEAAELDAASLRPARRVGQRSALPLLVATDAIALAVAIVGARLLYSTVKWHIMVDTALRSAFYVPLYLAVMACYGLYRRARRRLVASMFPDLSHLAHSLIVGSLLLLFTTGVAHRWLHLPSVDRGTTLLLGVFALVTVPAVRVMTRRLLRPSGRASSRVLIVGSGLVATTVLQRLSQVEGMQVVGLVDDGVPSAPHIADPAPRLGQLDDLPDVVVTHDVDHIVVAFSPATGAKLASLLRSLADDVQISVVPRLFDLLTVRSHVDDLHGLPVVDVAPAALGPADRMAKRALDIAVSASGLLLLSPVIAAVAVAVKVTSPGPVLFRQQRTGRNGKPFAICKFRTMRVGAEAERQDLAGANQVDGPLFKVHDDPRITRIGGILRPTSLDEIPQLFNVLKGDMSLVGPRPFVTAESAGIDGWAARRFDVRPGITGLWQISGRNDLPFDELRRLDYSYVASWSLWWDLRILWHTPGAVLQRRGAY